MRSNPYYPYFKQYVSNPDQSWTNLSLKPAQSAGHILSGKVASRAHSNYQVPSSIVQSRLPQSKPNTQPLSESSVVRKKEAETPKPTVLVTPSFSNTEFPRVLVQEIFTFLNGREQADFSVVSRKVHGDFVDASNKTSCVNQWFNRDFPGCSPRADLPLGRQYLETIRHSVNIDRGIYREKQFPALILDNCNSIALSDGRIASASRGEKIKIWNPSTGACEMTLEGHTQNVRHLLLLPDGRIASASYDLTIRIWNPSTGECEMTLEGHENSVYHLLLLPDGRIASASVDRTIKIWNPSTGACEMTLEGHSYFVNHLLLLPDGRIASASADRTIKILNPSTGACEMTLEGHTQNVRHLLLLPDGRIASASYDLTIRIWNPSTGTCEMTLEGHEGGIVHCLLLPFGQIASASQDNTIKIWTLSTGACEKTMKGHRNSLTHLLFLPNGRIASASADNTIKIWNPSTGACEKTLKLDDKKNFILASPLLLIPGRLICHTIQFTYICDFSITTPELLIRAGRRFAQWETQKAADDLKRLPRSLRQRVQAHFCKDEMPLQKAKALFSVAKEVFGKPREDSLLPSIHDQLQELETLLKKCEISVIPPANSASSASSRQVAYDDPEEKSISPQEQLKVLQSALTNDKKEAFQAHLAVLGRTNAPLLSRVHFHLSQIHETCMTELGKADRHYGRKVFASDAEAGKLCNKTPKELKADRLEAIARTMRELTEPLDPKDRRWALQRAHCTVS